MQLDKRKSPVNSLFRNILILVAFVYFFAAYYVWNMNIKETQATLHNLNSVVKQGVRATLKGHELVLRGLGNELVAHGALDDPRQGRALIERMKLIDPGMAGFGLARPDGQIVLISGIEDGRTLPNLATNKLTADSFKDVVASKQLRTGRPYYFKSLGEWVVPIRTAVFNNNNKLTAIMTAGYKIENASVSWANLDLPKDTRISIMRNDGYLIYNNPLPAGQREQSLSLSYSQPASEGVLKKVATFNKNKTFTTLTTPRLEVKEHYISYDYIPEYDLHVGALITKKAVFNNWLKRMLVPTMLFLIFMFGGMAAFKRASQRQELADREVMKLSSWQEAVLNAADYSIISTDVDGLIVSFNKTSERMLGYKASELIGKSTPAIFHDENEVVQRAAQLSEEVGVKVEPGFEVFVSKARIDGVEEREWTYIRKDKYRIPVYLSVTPLYDKNKIIGYLGIAVDLTEKKLIQENLRSTEARYRMLFDSATDAIFILSGNQFIDCNPATLKLFGCERHEIITKTPGEFSPEYQPDGRLSSDKAMEKINAALNGVPQFFEWQHTKLDSSPFDAEVSLTPLEISGQQYLLATVRDITDRKQLEDKLMFQSHHDSLTALPNRAKLHEAFSEYVNIVSTKNQNIILMLLDLDRFKEINDTLGHFVGDEVLKQIGPRIKKACSSEDVLIARLGGDEFVILANVNKSQDEIKALAEKQVQALREPFSINGIEVTVGVSIGIATYPQHGRDSHELLRAADVAMYQAKRLSIGVMAYDNEFDNYSTQRLGFVNELSRAVQGKQLTLHYQPKVNVITGDVVGFEALVRWQHPEQGLLYPDSFIDIVEMSEIIHDFTREVIELAASDKKRLTKLGYQQPIAINLSARNLYDDKCLGDIESALQKHNLSYSDIEVELTESAVMHDPDRSISVLNKFHEKGIIISIDDFGMGYSSLSYLRQLPVSALKIDRSFVMNMMQDEQDKTIVDTTITLAHSLNLKVVAEGVETDDALTQLKAMLCDTAQGYGICRPKPLEEITDWLSAAGK